MPQTNSSKTTIVWFRQDLRTVDHPALSRATELGPIVPVFIWSPTDEQPWATGAAARIWLADSLQCLAAELGGLGSRLIVRRGPALAALQVLWQETGAGQVFWSRRYEPHAARLDEEIRQGLIAQGCDVQVFPGALLFEPADVRNLAGLPFQVFTPFAKACRARPEPSEPLPAPVRLSPVDARLASVAIDALQLEPRLNWPAGIRAAWRPGNKIAVDRLRRFIDQSITVYEACRNLPDLDGTSRLSPYLHWGEISPRQVWHAVEDVRGLNVARRSAEHPPTGPEVFEREILWREFAYHLLVHFPHTDREPLRCEFREFPWRDDRIRLCAWQRGETGYPLVDAGMRQLWQTGWMHNRVRMVVASFLVKDLLIPWQRGAEWFWDTLVDADLANNSLGWQWTAGCGADAAPFFRIFNPVSQGEKFDPQGDFVRRWVQELAGLPAKWIHKPWQAPAEVLAAAGLRLGENYPERIVDHAEARTAALEAFARINASRATQPKRPKAQPKRH